MRVKSLGLAHFLLVCCHCGKLKRQLFLCQESSLFLFSLELVNHKDIKKKEAGPRTESKALLIKSHLLVRGVDRE